MRQPASAKIPSLPYPFGAGYAFVPGLRICGVHRRESLPLTWPPGLIADVQSVSQMFSTLLASAKTITIVVGGNGTNMDASLIFQPQEVKAAVGDIVVFNCMSALPCIQGRRAHPSTLDTLQSRMARTPQLNQHSPNPVFPLTTATSP